MSGEQLGIACRMRVFLSNFDNSSELSVVIAKKVPPGLIILAICHVMLHVDCKVTQEISL